MNFLYRILEWLISADKEPEDLRTHPDLLTMSQRQLGDIFIPPEPITEDRSIANSDLDARQPNLVTKIDINR